MQAVASVHAIRSNEKAVIGRVSRLSSVVLLNLRQTGVHSQVGVGALGAKLLCLSVL